MNRFIKSRSFWILVVTGITSLGFWYISTWEKSIIGDVKTFPYPWYLTPFTEAFYNGLLKNKIKVGIILGISSIVLQAIILYIPISIKRKRFIKATLTHIINQYLNGDITNNRITIYVAQRGYKMYGKYLWRCFVLNIRKHSQRKLLWVYIKNLPKPHRKYLIFSGRTGRPHENGTSTFFLIPESIEEVSGVAAYAFYERKPHFAELPDISSIDFSSVQKIDQLMDENHRDIIEEYMDKGKINSFEKLRMFHRYPQHLFATPIHDRNNEPFGVIVFDSYEKKLDFNKNLDNLLGYCKITESIINYIN